MARIICVANQKGGVGKTTTSVNLAAALTLLNKRVLIVDMDPQGNASSGLGVKRYENQEANIYQVLIGEKPIHETIQTTQVTNLDIIPANPDLVGAEIELVDMPQREYRLKHALHQVKVNYHYILIDCPPSLGLLTVNSLSAAETFLVPLQCEYYALEGLSQLLNTAGLIKKSLNPELRIEGICLTMFDARNNLSHQVVAEIQNHFGDKVFSAIIPRNVRLSEAPSHGQTIFQYDAKSLGAKKYKELAEELDQRVYGTTSANKSGADIAATQVQVKQAMADAPAPVAAPVVPAMAMASGQIEESENESEAVSEMAPEVETVSDSEAFAAPVEAPHETALEMETISSEVPAQIEEIEIETIRATDVSESQPNEYAPPEVELEVEAAGEVPPVTESEIEAAFETGPAPNTAAYHEQQQDEVIDLDNLTDEELELLTAPSRDGDMHV